jgi:peroxiredoxin
MKRAVILLVAALLCLGAAARSDPREAKFLSSMQLNADAKVRYFDERGTPLGFDAFLASAMEGRNFNVEHDGPESATFRLEPVKLAVAAPAAPARPAAPRKPAAQQLHAGAAFPAFALPSTQGKRVTAAALQGRLTLVNFFFADCLPCIAEIPALNAYARHYPEVQVLAVTFDDLATAKGFAKKRGLQWPILAEAQPLINAVGVTSYPTFALVGPDGRLRAISHSFAIPPRGAKLDVANLSTWVAKNRRK